jgi:peptidoglycan hydrolase-like protein with peptidoglycan-binding domain
VAAPGTDVVSGLVLYSVDDEPVVAVTGTAPLWRVLKKGVSAGTDVKMLERALVAAGYGDDLVVDRTFGADTARAVKKWEKDLGRSDPDGTVEIGDLVAVPAGHQVLDTTLDAGDAVQSGGQVLSLGQKQRIVSAQIPAEDVAIWAPGSKVTLTWSDDTTSTATITELGREVTDESIEMKVSAAGGSITKRVGTQADVSLVTDSRANVLAAPVAALHDAEGGGAAVTVIAADGATTERKVTLGLVAQGYAELASGVASGDRLRLP